MSCNTSAQLSSWFNALKADLDAVTSYAWNEYAKRQHLRGFERDLEAIVQEMSTVLSHLQAIQVRASVLSFDESEVAAIERNERQWAKQLALAKYFLGAAIETRRSDRKTASTCERVISLYEEVVATMKARVPAGDYQLHELALMLNNLGVAHRFARNYEQVCPSPTQTLLTIVSPALRPPQAAACYAEAQQINPPTVSWWRTWRSWPWRAL